MTYIVINSGKSKVVIPLCKLDFFRFEDDGLGEANITYYVGNKTINSFPENPMEVYDKLIELISEL
jgi:hypothetical protein